MTFSIKQSIKSGWAKTKANMETSIFTTLLTLAVGTVASNHNKGMGFLALLAGIFLMIIRVGYTKIFLRMADGEKPQFTDIFKEYHLFWKYLGLSILTGIAVAVGFVALIIPGIIFAVRFSLATFILVDTGMGPVASMKESWAITEGSFLNVFLFWMAIIGINILGFAALGVGLLITIPVSTFAGIELYRHLTKSKAGIATI